MQVKYLRCYEFGRTAHVERLRAGHDQLLYRRASYDFDESVASGALVRRATRREMFKEILRSSPQVVEVNEPLQMSAWLTTFVALAAVRLQRRRKIRVVSYAIENADIGAAFAHRFNLPRPIGRIVVKIVASLLYNSVDRICFGTDGAEKNYADIVGLGKFNRPSRNKVIGLPARSQPLSTRPDGVVVFVGSLEKRKGVLQLLDACDLLIKQTSITLRIVGSGPLDGQVAQFAASRDWVEIRSGLPRDQVLAAYSDAKVAVLLSQRLPEWREQVGLPIIEALASGLEVVTTTETGLATWLRAAGHRVVDADAPSAVIASAISSALKDNRSAETVVSALPKRDGRLEAGEWLLEGATQ